MTYVSSPEEQHTGCSLSAVNKIPSFVFLWDVVILSHEAKGGLFMARCLVFCAGGFDGLLFPPGKEDFIIAADGGVRHVQALHLTPDMVLGDFDSLGYAPENALRYPVEKDDTDAMLAARHGLQQGFAEFIFYGALEGPRLDHTIANLQTLRFLADRGAKAALVGKTQTVTLLKDGALSFPETAQGTISLFCMGSPAKGVTIRGLKYPLENGNMDAGFPLGVSNQFLGRQASVTVETGSLLVIYDRKNGILW